jgi:hypothetical protein
VFDAEIIEELHVVRPSRWRPQPACPGRSAASDHGFRPGWGW